MEKLNVIYMISSFLLMVIGGVMLLRQAFLASMWWGLGCILFPVVTPFLVVSRWPDTKKGLIIFSIGAAIFSGLYFVGQNKINRAIEEIKIVKITITPSLDNSNFPVSDLGQISLNEKTVYMHVKMQVPPQNYYRFQGELYDAAGKLVMNYTMPMVPRESVWNSWFYHNFDKSVDSPGEWRFVFKANGKYLGERRFDVAA